MKYNDYNKAEIIAQSVELAGTLPMPIRDMCRELYRDAAREEIRRHGENRDPMAILLHAVAAAYVMGHLAAQYKSRKAV